MNGGRTVPGAPTARHIAFVDEDGERTVAVHFGAAIHLRPSDINEEVLSTAGECSRTPIFSVGQGHGVHFSEHLLSPSDMGSSEPFHWVHPRVCVEQGTRLRAVASEVDILFGTELEFATLLDVAKWDELIPAIQSMSNLALVTRGSLGSAVVMPNQVTCFAATQVDSVVDTSGAGDVLLPDSFMAC